MTAEEYGAYIAALVDAAPPLSPAQTAEINAVFVAVAGGDRRGR